MKQLLCLSAIAFLALSACKKSSNNTLPLTLGGSTWVVSYFWDKDKDETSDFAGYTFLFNADGTLTASLPGHADRTGTWTLSDSDTKLTLKIAGTEALDELNEDWQVLEFSDTLIKLQDDNDTHEEVLHFQKN